MPVYLNEDCELVIQPENASYVLIAMYYYDQKEIQTKAGSFTQTGLEKQLILHNGMSVNARVIRIGELNCYYVKLRYCDAATKNITRQVGASLCGNFRHLFANGTGTVYEALDEDKNIARYYKRLATYECDYDISNKVIEKISQFHHIHVRLKDLYVNKDIVHVKGHEAYLVQVLENYTDKAITHASFITYYRALPDDERRLFIKLIIAYKKLDQEWLKEEGTVAKQIQGSSKFDLSKIFELNVLHNRIETPVDWSTEKDHRTKINVVNISYSKIYEHVRTLFELAKQEGKKPIKMDWDKYWMQRSSIMPGGAVHSQHEEINKYIRKLPRALKNKKGLACSLPYIDQQYFLSKTPTLESYVSTKYEWGKVRALYGCDFNSHVNADFGLLNCEDTFPHFIPTGPQATEGYVKNLLKTAKYNVPFCYDYDDFNSQHSKTSMQAVIDAWINTYFDDITEDQIASALWTRESIDEMYVNNSVTNDRYEANGTLFSGWRLTTFVNTALNYAYLAEAGINKLTNISIHNGDDVYAGVRNLKDIVVLLRNSKRLGIRANTTKMSIGTIAEFLRVDMRSENPTSAQYLTRGVATFVHGRVESEAPVGYRAMVSAYKTRYDEVLARGGGIKALRPLYRKQLFFARKKFSVSEDIETKLLETHVQAGGLDSKGKIGNYTLEDDAIHYSDIDIEEINSLIAPGVKDYVTSLKTLYPQIKEYITTKTVRRTITRAFNINKNTVIIKPASSKEIYNMIALKGAWADDASFRVFNRVRQGISNTIAVLGKLSNAHAKVLCDTKNPIKWLSIYIA